MKNLLWALLVFVGALCASTRPSFAQAAEVRTVPLAVLNPAGRVHVGLTAQDLRVKGINAEIRDVTFDAGPRRILLLLDMSGSMSEPTAGKVTKWDYAKEMAKGFLRATLPQNFVALDVFSDKEKQVVPFTHNFASISAALDALPAKPEGRTAAGDALHAALLDFGEAPAFGDSVIFISDGEFGPDPSHRSLFSLRADVAVRDVRVFLLLPSVSSVVETPEELMPDMNTFDFISGTGGYSFAPKVFPGDWPPSEIYRSDPGERIIALADAVQGTYRVQLQLTQPLRKKRDLHLETVGSDGKSIHGLFLYYPRVLYPD